MANLIVVTLTVNVISSVTTARMEERVSCHFRLGKDKKTSGDHGNETNYIVKEKFFFVFSFFHYCPIQPFFLLACHARLTCV